MDLKRIYLTGFMGSGKTTVGRILAELLYMPFTDLDEFIVERAGKSIPEIFEQEGEQVFRIMEAEAVRIVSAWKGVFGLGGGAVLDSTNRDILMSTGLVVYLKAAPVTLARRLQHESRGRPLLAGEDDLEDRIGVLLDEREGVYESAHWKIKTDELTTEQVASVLHSRLKEEFGD